MTVFDKDGNGFVVVGPNTIRAAAKILRSKGMVEVPVYINGMKWYLFISESPAILLPNGLESPSCGDYLYYGTRNPGRLSLWRAAEPLPKTRVSDWRISGSTAADRNTVYDFFEQVRRAYVDASIPVLPPVMGEANEPQPDRAVTGDNGAQPALSTGLDFEMPRLKLNFGD